MKITCYTAALCAAVDNVKKAAAVKTETEAMRCVHIHADSDIARLTCCDLQTGISAKVSVTVQEPGKVCLNAKMLYEILRKLTGETVSIETGNGEKVTIKSGRCKHTMLSIDAGMFPQWPHVDGAKSVRLDADAFCDAVRSVAFSVSTNPTKPLYTGIHLDLADNELRLVATDTFRLASTAIDVPYSGEVLRCTVPAKSLTEAAKLFSGVNEVKVCFGKRNLQLEADNYTVLSYLLDGEYLDFKRTLPMTHATVLHVGAADLADCIDRVSVWSGDAIKAPVDLKISEAETECTMSTSIGASSDSVTSRVEGTDEFRIRFNGRFLTEALRALGNIEACIGMSGSAAPVKIWRDDKPETIYIVLPVRMRETGATS